jgi:predicted dehydrogenase/threonine dehydrogenase-like Zn-dependent dehydrogenase
MLLEFGKANWIEKARQQPDKVRMVLDKFCSDGFTSTLESVRCKLDQPIALGYSNTGVVLEVGPGVTEFRAGDRVISNGPHAEVVSVPKNLCAKIPDAVSDDAAAFTVVGAIGLQGIRLAEPQLGEAVVVTGLGLIGLICVQLLRAHGCRVLGIDFDGRRLAIAQSFGAETVDLSTGEDPVAAAERFSRGRGVDAVLITAATKSNEPVRHAALMSRKRGRIVLVGVAGLELSRDDFYKKELSFQVSCSYGPGRYDPVYEEGGHDYPYSHVRWTAQRNFEAVLDMMADGRLQVEPLITHRVPFDRALDAYKLLEGDEFYIGILLQYGSVRPNEDLLQRRVVLRPPVASAPPSNASLCFIGAGAYASKILIPAFQQSGARLVSIASKGGLSAAHAGRKFGFEEATTDVDAMIASPAVDTVVIATRHDTHASLVCRALRAGKHVFVEKPLALDAAEIDEIERTWCSLAEPRLLMVGFNRRFAPHVARLHELLRGVKAPKAFVYTVNAGAIPPDHWTQDSGVGGRILGEACHFIDLLRFLAGCPTTEIKTSRQSPDTVTITLAYENGSIGTIHYFATGHKSFPKERLEVFAGGHVLVLDNFRTLQGFGWPRFRKMKRWAQNKGAAEMAAAFVAAIRAGAPAPIPYNELLEVSRLTIQAASL